MRLLFNSIQELGQTYTDGCETLDPSVRPSPNVSMLLPDLAAQDLMNLCSLLYFGKDGSCLDFGIKQLVVDPDPHGSALFFWLSWIRARIGNAYPDPDP
jgi:hypothetical protein